MGRRCRCTGIAEAPRVDGQWNAKRSCRWLRRLGFRLRLTGRRDEEYLALVDEVSVAKFRIGLGDARPGSAVMQLRLRDGPDRVAVADGVLHGSVQGSDGSRKKKLRPGSNQVWIANFRIESEQFLPAVPVAKARRGELPERVAGLDSDDRVFPRGGR